MGNSPRRPACWRSTLPVFLPSIGYRSFPLKAIHEAAHLALTQAAAAAYFPFGPKSLFRLLENFLQVTGQELTLCDLASRSFERIYFQFVGVINSEKFIELSPQRRSSLITQWVALARALNTSIKLQFEPDDAFKLGIKKLTLEVDALPLLQVKVNLYSGWKAISLDGKCVYLHLYQLQEKLGQEFCDQFFCILKTYIAGRRKARLPAGVPELVSFLGDYDLAGSSSDFADRTKVFYLLRDFCIYFFRSGCEGENANSVAWQRLRWTQYLAFHKGHLEAGQLFAAPLGPYPSPPPRRLPTGIRHIASSVDNQAITHKLLTPVPLFVTDAEAIQILFESIQRDISLIVAWADAQCAGIWHRYQRRVELQASGEARVRAPRKGPNGTGRLTDKSNPQWIANAAATFERNGYLCGRDTRLSRLYGGPLKQAAYELAIPTTSSLLPHCCILVAEHPAITDAFLEDFILYDESGKQVGMEETDAGVKLIGYKPRRGPRHSEQKILLSEKALAVFCQLIALTEPLRTYLKARGDDSWRYLLLTAGSAFGRPIRMGRFAAMMHRNQRTEAHAAQIQELPDISPAEALSLATRFSLSRLRASAGVKVYLDTLSVAKMSEALGHAEHNRTLLQSYLPEPIARFFIERWIRIFQNAFIVEVMKDHPLLGKVTDFETPEGLHKFMTAHVLKVPPNLEPNTVSEPEELASKPSAVFCISADTLAALIMTTGTTTRAEEVGATKRYWSLVSEHLLKYIRTQMTDREDIQECLIEAERIVQEARHVPKA